MKTNKEQVIDFLKRYHVEGQCVGATTQYLSKALAIGRSNVSAILSTLYREGLVCKSDNRPVLYYAKKSSQGSDCFAENMVGSEGSLSRAVQLAKAAVLYPQGNLNVLIRGLGGTGKKMLAMLMHSYGIVNRVFPSGTPCELFDCKKYQSEREINAALFGTEGSGGVYHSLKRGVLIIDDAGRLSRQTYTKIIEQSEQEHTHGSQHCAPLQVILLCDTSQREYFSTQKPFPITIDLPSLKDRPLSERKELIQKFLTLESIRAGRTIMISAEVMRCLLLYDTDSNIARLKYDIKMGCANAYVREHNIKSDSMNLYVSDFENYVRKGFLHYKTKRDEVEQIIPADYSYIFDENSVEMTALDRDKLKNPTLYKLIARRSRELTDNGVSDEDINMLIIWEIESLFKTYQNNLINKVTNYDQLSRLVDASVIKIVHAFLENAAEKLEVLYPSSVFYGLCVHLDTTLKTGSKNTGLTGGQIQEIIENHEKEYLLGSQLASSIEKEFGIALSDMETALITMFLIHNKAPDDTAGKPVVLYIFRSTDMAKALSALVNQSLKSDNAFYFEIPLDQELDALYDELRDYILQINRGNGVLVYYDAEYMSKVITMVEMEANVEIRKIYTPMTDIAMEASHRATENDINALYSGMIDLIHLQEQPISTVIVTLCASGKGAAAELKQYVERYKNDDDIYVIALASSNREDLREKLSTIMETAKIKCVIGTQDPQMFALPFVPAADVFGCNPEDLTAVLNPNRHHGKLLSRGYYEEVYQYLEMHLKLVDIQKLKKLLPKTLMRISSEIIPLSHDSEIGLFLHIPCSLERALTKEEPLKCIQKSQIINQYNRAYRKLLKIMKPLEKAYSVIFSDDELAIILTIILKL